MSYFLGFLSNNNSVGFILLRFPSLFKLDDPSDIFVVDRVSDFGDLVAKALKIFFSSGLLKESRKNKTTP